MKFEITIGAVILSVLLLLGLQGLRIKGKGFDRFRWSFTEIFEALES